jgi:hypothetical protein
MPKSLTLFLFVKMLVYFVNIIKIKVIIYNLIVNLLSKKISYLYLRRIFYSFTNLFDSTVQAQKNYEAVTFNYTSPDSIDLSHGFNSRNIFVIKNSLIDPLTGQVFVKDFEGNHTFISESSSWDPHTSHIRLRSRDGAFSRKPLRTFKSPDTVFHVSPFPGSNGFYHWLIEDLPAYLRCSAHSPEVTFVTGGKLVQRCREVMEVMQSKYMLSSNYVSSEFVTFAERGHEKALAHPFDLDLICELSSRIYKPTSELKPTQITFLKRGKLLEKNRSLDISNSNLFLNYKVSFIEPEHMQLVDLIRELSKSNTVIGFHGGNLANIVWVSNIQNCIEIVNDAMKGGIDTIRWICKVKQINYFRINFNPKTSEVDLLTQILFILDNIN